MKMKKNKHAGSSFESFQKTDKSKPTWRIVLLAAGLAIGVIVGQKIMVTVYDPSVLEEAAIILVGNAYMAGCAEAKHNLSADCKNEAKSFMEDTAKTFHDEIWGKR